MDLQLGIRSDFQPTRCDKTSQSASFRLHGAENMSRSDSAPLSMSQGQLMRIIPPLIWISPLTAWEAVIFKRKVWPDWLMVERGGASNGSLSVKGTGLSGQGCLYRVRSCLSLWKRGLKPLRIINVIFIFFLVLKALNRVWRISWLCTNSFSIKKSWISHRTMMNVFRLCKVTDKPRGTEMKSQTRLTSGLRVSFIKREEAKRLPGHFNNSITAPWRSLNHQ